MRRGPANGSIREPLPPNARRRSTLRQIVSEPMWSSARSMRLRALEVFKPGSSPAIAASN
jgi:hypothetical protein